MTSDTLRHYRDQQAQAVQQQRQVVYALLGQLRSLGDRLADAIAYLEQLQARQDQLEALLAQADAPSPAGQE